MSCILERQVDRVLSKQATGFPFGSIAEPQGASRSAAWRFSLLLFS
jgi:hypothetical protein